MKLKDFVFISILLIAILFSSCVRRTATTPDTTSTSASTIGNTVVSTPILVFPKNYQSIEPTGSVNLTWNATTFEKVTFDLYYGERTLSLIATSLSNFSYNVSTEPHKSYVWEVVANYNGQSKSSKIGHFMVKCKGW